MPTTRQRLDTLLLLLLPHLPAKAQRLHKPTSTVVVVVPVAEQKKIKKTQVHSAPATCALLCTQSTQSLSHHTRTEAQRPFGSKR